eukprot:42312_1
MALLLFTFALCLAPRYEAIKETVEFEKIDLRSHPCKDSSGCEYICHTLRCKNELFEADTKPKAHKSEAASALVTDIEIEDTSDKSSIDVRCQDPLSCVGSIKINGKYMVTPSGFKLYKYHGYDASIKCGTGDTQSCTGGIYQFLVVGQAIFSGNAQESIITFKKVETATVYVEGTDEKQFFNNLILNEDVHFFHLDASAPHSASGTVVNLHGVKRLREIDPTARDPISRDSSRSTITCAKQGSCAGMVVIAPKIGGDITIECGCGACERMVVMLTQDSSRSVELPSFRDVRIAVCNNPERRINTPKIFILCEGEPSIKLKTGEKDPAGRAICVFEGVSVHPLKEQTRHRLAHKTTRGRDALTNQFNSEKALKDAIEKDLKELEESWDGTKTGVSNNAAWLLEENHLGHWGGVSLEAAYGGWLGVPTTVAQWTLSIAKHMKRGSAEAFATTLGQMVTLTTFSTAFPVLAPLVIIGAIFTGFKVLKWHIERKKRQKWELAVHRARDEVGSFYDADADEDEEEDAEENAIYAKYLSYDYAADGSVVLYDLFSGQKYDPEAMRLQSDDEVRDLSEDIVSDQYWNKPRDFVRIQHSGSGSPLLIGGIVGASTIVVIMLVFCLGLTFGMVIYWGYSQKRALDVKRKEEEMRWIDSKRNEL